MQKIKLERINRKTGETEEIEIYDSLSPKRLEEETREEYKNRRVFIAHLDKERKKRRNMVHVSSELIPLKDEEGKVLLINKKPIWIGKSKGKTFIKEK